MMGEDTGEAVNVTSTADPDRVYGKKLGIGICWDGESETNEGVINTLKLAVHYHEAGEYVGKRMIDLIPGTIGTAMKQEFKEAKAVAAAEEPPIEPGAEGYPEMGDPEATFLAAVSLVEGGAGAKQIVTLMATHEDHKGWGRIMLSAAWDKRNQ